MLEQLKSACSKVYQRRGSHRKLSLKDMLLMTPEYYKEYGMLACIGASYGLKKANAGKVINRVEELLIGSIQFVR